MAYTPRPWHTKPPIWGALGLLLGMVVGAAGIELIDKDQTVLHNTALRQSDLTPNNPYKYIDPLIGIQNAGNATNPIYQPLEDSIQKYINTEKAKGNLEASSVNFRDITRSGGFVLNPTEKYSPASLLKVPTMMAYFKIAEKTPAILEEKLLYAGAVDENAQEHIRSDVQLIPGRSYTIEELIEHMIKNSDNNAAMLLVDHLNTTNHEEAFNSLFQDLGITQIDLTDDFITVQAYALFFRVLYNSTYLSRDMSEKSLAILSQTDFDGGITSSLPKNIPAAHKFGEFTLAQKDGSVIKQELHDCGYIYYPQHVYSLCVMTKGNDLMKLKTVIEEISKRTHDFIAG